MKVLGRKTMVTAAIVIMDAESRCVCSATLAVEVTISVEAWDSFWAVKLKSCVAA